VPLAIRVCRLNDTNPSSSVAEAALSWLQRHDKHLAFSHVQAHDVGYDRILHRRLDVSKQHILGPEQLQATNRQEDKLSQG